MEVQEVKDAAIEFLTKEISSGFDGHPSKLYGWTGHRSKGVHLSDILQDLYKRMNNPRAKKAGGEAVWSVGLAWEHVLSWGWSQVFPDQPDRIIHLGEFERDGIAMTPDRMDAVWPGVVEMKATFKSAKKWPITEQWLWLQQVKCYCHALGFDQARFYVLHIMDIMGMYGGEPIPPKVWEVKFTPGEIQRSWEMVLGHRDVMVKEGKLKC